MLAGFDVHACVSISSQTLTKAKENLRKFDFVGIEEHLRESAQLLKSKLLQKSEQRNKNWLLILITYFFRFGEISQCSHVGRARGKNVALSRKRLVDLLLRKGHGSVRRKIQPLRPSTLPIRRGFISQPISSSSRDH